MTKDPELKTTQNGVSVCSYDLAVKRPRVKDVTDFIPCVSWRHGAEYLAKYGRKGDVVALSGALTTRAWQDKNGNKHIAYEVTAETVELIGGRKEETKTAEPVSNDAITAPAYVPTTGQGVDVMYSDEELPF